MYIYISLNGFLIKIKFLRTELLAALGQTKVLVVCRVDSEPSHAEFIFLQNKSLFRYSKRHTLRVIAFQNKVCTLKCDCEHKKTNICV